MPRPAAALGLAPPRTRPEGRGSCPPSHPGRRPLLRHSQAPSPAPSLEVPWEGWRPGRWGQEPLCPLLGGALMPLLPLSAPMPLPIRTLRPQGCPGTTPGRPSASPSPRGAPGLCAPPCCPSSLTPRSVTAPHSPQAPGQWRPPGPPGPSKCAHRARNTASRPAPRPGPHLPPAADPAADTSSPNRLSSVIKKNTQPRGPSPPPRSRRSQGPGPLGFNF